MAAPSALNLAKLNSWFDPVILSLAALAQAVFLHGRASGDSW